MVCHCLVANELWLTQKEKLSSSDDAANAAASQPNPPWLEDPAPFIPEGCRAEPRTLKTGWKKISKIDCETARVELINKSWRKVGFFGGGAIFPGRKKSSVRMPGVTNFQPGFINTGDPASDTQREAASSTVFFLFSPLDPIQRDPMLSGLKRVGVNYVITAPLSLGELPKQ